MPCDDCGGDLRLDPAHDELVCQRCGVVSANEAVATAERLGKKEDREWSPMGSHEVLADRGLGSVFLVDEDGQGNRLTRSARNAARRLNYTHEIQTVRSDPEFRRRNAAYRTIGEAGRLLDASDLVIADARHLHTLLEAKPLERFPKMHHLAGALVVCALRLRGMPMPLTKAAERLGIDFRPLVQTIKRVQNLIPATRASLSAPLLARQYAERFGRPDLGQAAAAAVEALPPLNFSPLVLAAAACYTAFRSAKAPLNRARLLAVTGVSRSAFTRCRTVFLAMDARRSAAAGG